MSSLLQEKKIKLDDIELDEKISLFYLWYLRFNHSVIFSLTVSVTDHSCTWTANPDVLFLCVGRVSLWRMCACSGVGKSCRRRFCPGPGTGSKRRTGEFEAIECCRVSELSPPSLSWKDKTRIFRLASLKPAGFCTWSCYLSVLSLQYNNTITQKCHLLGRTQKWVHTQTLFLNVSSFFNERWLSSMPSSWTAILRPRDVQNIMKESSKTADCIRRIDARTNWRCCPRLRLSGFQTSDTHTYTLHFFRQLFKHIWLNLALKFANCSRFLLEASSDFAFFHSSYLWLQSQRYVSWSSWKGVGASGRLGVSAGITVSHPEK